MNGPKIIAEYRVERLEQIERLSDFCIGRFELLPSRKSVKKAIQSGRLLLNGQKGHTGDWVKEGALIQVLASDEPSDKVYEMSIPIVFEDDFEVIGIFIA